MIKDNWVRGDRHPGSEWNNAVARAANFVAEQKQSVHNSVAVSNNSLSGQVVIDVENIFDGILPRLMVLEIDYPLWREGYNDEIVDNVLNRGIVYKGLVPTGEEGKTVVVTLTNLRPGEINRAVIMGVVPSIVNVLDTSHRFARPIAGSTMGLESSESGNIRLVLQPTKTGIQVIDVMLGFGGGGTGTAANTQTATVILPICRAINPNAKGDWTMPFENVYQTEHNSRTHFAAQCGYVSVDGKTYSPKIAFVENDGLPTAVIHYFKNIRVSSDTTPDGLTATNAHYRTGTLHRPIIVYADSTGNEWKPWEDGIWETTIDPAEAFPNYDLAACPTLDYSEVLVPGERVKVLRTEQHSYYEPDWDVSNVSLGNPTVPPDGIVLGGMIPNDMPLMTVEPPGPLQSIMSGIPALALQPTTTTVVIVEPPDRYTVEFEGTSDADEFGVWNKERKLTNNQSDVVSTTIDAYFTIGIGPYPYDYWGFDTVGLLPNGDASWNFVNIAAFPKLEKIENPTNSPDIDDTWVSRPILTDTVKISNTACNTRAYGLWYKTDRDGIRYPILCSVESLTQGTAIETRKVNCSTGDCSQKWTVHKIPIERDGSRLVLPTSICAVNCPGTTNNSKVVVP